MGKRILHLNFVCPAYLYMSFDQQNLTFIDKKEKKERKKKEYYNCITNFIPTPRQEIIEKVAEKSCKQGLEMNYTILVCNLVLQVCLWQCFFTRRNRGPFHFHYGLMGRFQQSFQLVICQQSHPRYFICCFGLGFFFSRSSSFFWAPTCFTMRKLHSNILFNFQF